VVNTATLNANPKLGKALIGAWYETLGIMFKNDAAAKAAQTAMAKAAGTDSSRIQHQFGDDSTIRDSRTTPINS